MNRTFLQAGFYETYYFASSVRNILNDRFAYIRLLNDFYGDGNYLAFTSPFPRYSAFHHFLDFVIGNMLTDDTANCKLDIRQDQFEQFKKFPAAQKDIQPEVLPVEHALRFYDIPHISFMEWLQKNGKSFDEARDDDVCSYLDELSGEGATETLQEQAVRETFFLLFSNRHLLLQFNSMMADQISEAVISDLKPEYRSRFRKDGVLRRATIPRWVKKPVFYRDRGLCGNCGTDLSGTVSIWSDAHYDHIVPLAVGGLNDVTNIQLLCEKCNLKKNDGAAVTSSNYEDWYPLAVGKKFLEID